MAGPAELGPGRDTRAAKPDPRHAEGPVADASGRLSGRLLGVSFPRLPVATVVSGLDAGLFAGASEDIGWTGFALPRLPDAHSAIASDVVPGRPWGVGPALPRHRGPQAEHGESGPFRIAYRSLGPTAFGVLIALASVRPERLPVTRSCMPVSPRRRRYSGRFCRRRHSACGAARPHMSSGFLRS